MADTAKTLGQSNPAAVTLIDLYTVPAATSAVIGSIIICNQAAASATFRISVAVAGASDTAKQYIYYDETVPGNKTFIATIGITLATTDVLRIYASTANISFNLSGVEIT